jgi:precorrin-8X/cobalt-precorrin-8 methylmutase
MENIILVGHGSPRKEANNIEVIGNLLHKTIHPGCDGQCVRVAYMQFASPDIPETISACAEAGATKVILHPFFLSPGMHVTKDIPGMIEEARARHRNVEFIYTEPLGVHEGLAEIVLDRIRSATFAVPEDIEKRSFDIIGDEIDFGNTPAVQIPIIKRVIHTTADFEFMQTLVFHPEAVVTGIEAIKSGKDILTDVEMVKTGINKKLLSRWGGKVICNIQNSAENDEGNTMKTRAERGIESALKENNNIGIIAIGNAPTALLKTIEILNNSGYTSRITHQDPLVVGVPVGFVKALESKSLLGTRNFPFITNLSRKGGSPVAAAIVNALLKIAADD